MTNNGGKRKASRTDREKPDRELPEKRLSELIRWLRIPEASRRAYVLQGYGPGGRSVADELLNNKKKAAKKRANSWDPVVLPAFGLIRKDGDLVDDPAADRFPQIPPEIVHAISRLDLPARVRLAQAWEEYLRQMPNASAPTFPNRPVFPPLPLQEPADIIVWAHGDLMGGTELACVLALALLRASPSSRIAVATPCPDFVETCYGPEIRLRLETPKLIHLCKRADGGVDPDETAKAFKKMFLEYPIEEICSALADAMKPAFKPGHTLIISCGEPLALGVAKHYRCTSIIVTDHLVALTMGRVLKNSSGNHRQALRVLDELRALEREATEVYLPPDELASPEYLAYFQDFGIKPTPLRGLFYDGPGSAPASPEASQLAQLLSPGTALVCLFAGSGTSWTEILKKVTDLCENGAPRSYALLLQVTPVKVGSEWKLFLPGDRTPRTLRPPRWIRDWYAQSDLVVGSGGLVAQQVLGCAYAGGSRVPMMLFVEQRGHPQIESVRERLDRIGLVSTTEMQSFRDKPLQVVAEKLERRESELPEYVRRVRLHYGSPVVDELAAHVVSRYLRRESRSARTAGDWRSLRVLVTGSAGFIGKHLVARLRELSAEIIEYDCKDGGPNVCDRTKMALAGATVDVTFHLAGPSSIQHFRENAKLALETTMTGLSNILEFTSGRVVFPSTASIYGSSVEPAVVDREPSFPQENLYAKAKLSCERQILNSDRDVRIARIFSAYGPGDRGKGLVGSPVAQFLTATSRGARPVLYGDGTQVRDFVYIADVVESLIQLAMLESAPIVNVGTGVGTSFRQLLETIDRATGKKSLPKNESPPLWYVPSIVAEPSTALRIDPPTRLEDGIRKTIQADYPELSRRRMSRLSSPAATPTTA